MGTGDASGDTTSPLRVGIIVVAYNAASTLAAVLDRIPAEFRPRIERVYVGDDASSDSTHLIALGYRELNDDLTLDVVRHPVNLGYGGNQKAGYQWAIEHDLDVVVLLHGDGQYTPEMLPEIVAPFERGADAVFGSRMLESGGARRGGMPMYKYVGNRILSTFENAVAGTSLSEWHSGYRAYSVDSLRSIPFERNDDGFNFDTQIILQLVEAGRQIVEIPIPTYYGDEICHVNGMAYAWDVAGDVLRYRAHKMGLGTGELAFNSAAYEAKDDDDSSHAQLLRLAGGLPRGRTLDLGCNDGHLGQALRDLGHHVTGVDLVAHEGVKERLDRFVQADLDDGLPVGLEGPFDLVLLADVLEHVRQPEALLQQLRPLVAPGGVVLASVPNFGHWYPRARVALGRFDYDRRGILDRDHVRFFTRRSFERLAHAAGFTALRRAATGLPLEVIDRGGELAAADGSGARRAVAKLDRAAVRVRPQLFAYQFLYELHPAPRDPA